ncbi:hypothetical protein FNAPI_10779 [Fusarium napiforme]|uniref:Uncharacterized protein n=1 Tax=Fusarium napiforme TaxID=42672 RepID=A0A8H5IPB4_9HYPO|nr:hypothetical protein FNAPI_10779 [Fusarium napiforme]
MLLLTPDQIQKVSIVVGKYDMAARFAMAGTVWMDCDPINLEDAWKLMTASYWLDHQVGFRRMSEYVIGKLNHAQIFRLANETFDVALGLKLGMALLLCAPCTLTGHGAPEGSQAVPVQAITALADLIKASTGGEGELDNTKESDHGFTFRIRSG